MNSGKYRYPAELWSDPQPGNLSRENTKPEKLCDLWISITPKTGSETLNGDGMVSIQQFELRTPWQPIDIDPEVMKIRTEKYCFNLSSVVNTNEANQEFVMMATREVK